MQQSERKPINTEDIAKKWNSFSTGYSQEMAPNFESLGLHLFHLAGGSQADAILEVGCGDGLIAYNICLQKKEHSRLIITDLAENMCRLAAGKFDLLSERIKSGKIMGLRQEISCAKESTNWSLEKGSKWEELNVELYQADNEDLRQVLPEGNCVDCYIANLSLHIVSNPEKMLKESLRVLKPGKKAIFTVWGNEEDSQNFSLLIRAEEKFGISTGMKEYFYLKDRKKSIKLLEDAGFVDVLGWEMMLAFKQVDRTVVAEQMKRYAGSNFASETEDFRQMVDFLVEERRKLQDERKFPNGLSVLILMGTKPAN